MNEEPKTDKDEATAIRVFISYSRKDSAFAEKLRSLLIARGFAAFLDKVDILPGEPWRDRLDSLILSADVVVFIISPDSVVSEICHWEVERTLGLKKILTPLYWRAVPNDIIPPGIADRNYVFFDAYERSGLADSSVLEQSLEKLDQALQIADFLWVREHSKWVSRAAEWDQASPSRPETRLLSAGDAAAVEAWARLKPSGAPDIPEMLADYLLESIEKSERDSIRLRKTAGRAFVKPAEQALQQGWPDRAIRLAAAGAIVADDMNFALVPQLWPVLAQATIQSRLLAKLEGHTDAIRDIAFSPDGNLIGTVSSDQTTRIWNAATGEELRCFGGHTKDVYHIAFNPDGRHVATTSSDDKVIVSDIVSGQNLYGAPGIGVAFNADGGLMATADRYGGAVVWNLTTGKMVAQLKGHEKLINSVRFNEAGDRIITGSYDGSARIWDSSSGSEIKRLTIPGAYFTDARFSNDGVLAASITSSDNVPRVWSVESGSELARLEGHEDSVQCIAFNSVSEQIVSGSDDATARIWDCKTGAEETRLSGHSKGVRTVSFNPDGSIVATAALDNTARLWDAADGAEFLRFWGNASLFSNDGMRVATADWQSVGVWETRVNWEISRLGGRDTKIERASLSPDKSHVLAVNPGGTATVWEAETGSEISTLNGHKSYICSARFSPCGDFVITASGDRTARIWSARTGRELACLVGHLDQVRSAVFNSSGDMVLTASEDGTARLWSVETGKMIRAMEGHEGRVNSARFSPDGAKIVTASADKTARVWDLATGRELACLVGHEFELAEASFDPDGKRILTRSDATFILSTDLTARVWDAETGIEICCLSGHGHKVASARFDPTGLRVVTGCWDRGVRIFDSSSGSELIRLKGHTHFVHDAMFSPDGRLIATASDDRTARIWEAATGHEIALYKGHCGGFKAASFSSDGNYLVTTPNTDSYVTANHPVQIWDVSRTKVFAWDATVVLAAALASGVGRRTTEEADDLLLQDAPVDMFETVRSHLDDRSSDVDAAISALRAPAHPNCYLSPSQHARKFNY